MAPNLIIASSNQGKLREIQQLLPEFSLQTLMDIGFAQEIEEPFDTFRENAAIKARTVYGFVKGKSMVMAEDSGICVPALNGAPGVLSARYAGLQRSDKDNNELLLKNLESVVDRSAYYKAVVCLILGDGREYYFEGACYGSIAATPQGTGGFGYDPLFIPEGYAQTFGELNMSIKLQLSHRGAALQEMQQFLINMR